MERYQRRQLRIALKELKNIDDESKKSLEERIMNIRNMH